MLLTSVTPTNLIFKKENHKREKKHFQYLLKKKSMYKWTLAVQTRKCMFFKGQLYLPSFRVTGGAL